MTNADHLDPVAGYDLREYRKTVAKFVKLMIRARATAEPDFLTAEQYERWHLANIANDSFALEQLLIMAERAHDRLDREFIGPEGSGGISSNDPRAELKENVVHFTTGTPPSAILDAVRKRKKVKWQEVVEWDRLNAIRDGLNGLPEPTMEAPARGGDCPVVITNRDKRMVEVLGTPDILNPTRFDVITALVDVHPGRLSGDLLITRSNHTDAVKILKRLAKKPNWADVINLAGHTGQGYGLTIPSAD